MMQQRALSEVTQLCATFLWKKVSLHRLPKGTDILSFLTLPVQFLICSVYILDS